jgi:alpha-D-ribose 1-methylphosphonate 5-triphosphate synthase subunit PhnG
MAQPTRQQLLSTLAHSRLNDIQALWQDQVDDIAFEFIRQPECGMVMAVGRAGSSGEPFNLGEVTVSRCAVRLPGGETGFGYVKGRDTNHALHIALLDALAQTRIHRDQILDGICRPLQKKLQSKKAEQQARVDKTRVDFFTMIRGED